jgi:hypothetical protein
VGESASIKSIEILLISTAPHGPRFLDSTLTPSIRRLYGLGLRRHGIRAIGTARASIVGSTAFLWSIQAPLSVVCFARLRQRAIVPDVTRAEDRLDSR